MVAVTKGEVGEGRHGSVPYLAISYASVVQLDRALAFEVRKCGFESYREHQHGWLAERIIVAPC